MAEDRRQDDVLLKVLQQQVSDFIKYDKDRWDNFEKKYEKDWEHTQTWRNSHWAEIQDVKKSLDEILPNYRRGMWIVLLIISGSVGLLLKTFWAHIKLD